MEHYINIIFDKKITLGKVEETVNSVVGLGNVPLNEDGLEYEIFKEDKNFGISIPLIKHLDESEITEFVNNIAENLFDKGFDNFDIELSLNEATRLTTFEPWRREIEAAGYTISPSGTNIRSRDGSGTVAGINDNGNLWSGSETITRIVRGNTGDTSNTAADANPERSFGTFNADGTVDGPGQAARPGRRPDPISSQPRNDGSVDTPTDEPSDTTSPATTDEPSDTTSTAGYRVRGNIVVGRDVVTSNGRRINKQWQLNINDNRELTIIGSPNTYVNVHVVRRQDAERVRVYVEERNNFVILNAEFVNLLEAIKETVADYTTALPMENGRVVRPDAEEPNTEPPEVQTDVEQPQTPTAATTPDVEITGQDETDIPILQAGLGDPIPLRPPLDPGETSPVTGIANPVRYGSNMISGMPDIVYNSLQRLGDTLTQRNAMAFRDTLNYELLSREQAQSIIREMERLYPLTDIAQAIRENDLPEGQKESLIILLEVRQELNRFINSGGDEQPPEQPPEEVNDEPTQRGDGGLAVAREARDITREIHTNLGNAITGANTDEEAIQAALQRIENETMWNTVIGTYANRYPKPARNNLRTGTLLGDLRGAISRRDWRRYVQPELDRLGIEEEYNSPATNESVDAMKINDIVYEETYDGDDFFEAYGVMWYNEDEELDEAEYQGRTVKLGKPMKGDVKKFKVYVKNPKGNVVKVNFGDPNMRIKKSNPARRKSFRARHNCDNPGPRHKARYWSCRKW